MFSLHSPEGYMVYIAFMLILLNAFNNLIYCKAVCNRNAFNVYLYPNGNIIFMFYYSVTLIDCEFFSTFSALEHTSL